ncbi:MAG: hypothetical protein AAFX00_03385 [Pseudomonadota bacterium]
MAKSLSLGHQQAKAADAVRTFQLVYGVNLFLQVLACVLILIVPDFGNELVGTNPHPGIALWAATVIFVSSLQILGLMDPIQGRWLIVIALAGRILMTVVALALGPEYIRIAIYDGVWAIVLGIFLRRALIAELQTRP